MKPRRSERLKNQPKPRVSFPIPIEISSESDIEDCFEENSSEHFGQPSPVNLPSESSHGESEFKDNDELVFIRLLNALEGFNQRKLSKEEEEICKQLRDELAESRYSAEEIFDTLVCMSLEEMKKHIPNKEASMPRQTEDIDLNKPLKDEDPDVFICDIDLNKPLNVEHPDAFICDTPPAINEEENAQSEGEQHTEEIFPSETLIEEISAHQQHVQMIGEEKLICYILEKSRTEAAAKIGECSGINKDDEEIPTAGTGFITPIPVPSQDHQPQERATNDEDREMVQLEEDIDDPVNWGLED